MFHGHVSLTYTLMKQSLMDYCVSSILEFKDLRSKQE